MKIYYFLFYKTHSLLYPLMSEINKTFSDVIIVIWVSLSQILYIISIIASIESRFHLGIKFNTKLSFTVFCIFVSLTNYFIYSDRDKHKIINKMFKEPLLQRIITSIIVIFYYFFSVKYLFYSIDNSPWR